MPFSYKVRDVTYEHLAGMTNSPEAVDVCKAKSKPAKFVQHQHSSVNFLDLDIQIKHLQGSAEFAFKIYRKPGSASMRDMHFEDGSRPSCIHS